MNDAIDLMCADYAFYLVVIADISFDKWNLYAVLCTKESDAGLKALVERVIDND
jgi:hypothetical protein